jgi:flagellar biogenesis protein FliO
MFRKFVFAALSVFVFPAAPLAAENTPAPPNWQDGQGPSVYLQTNQTQAVASTDEGNTYSVGTLSAERIAPAEPAPRNSAPPKIDSAVVPAVHEVPSPHSSSDSRRLAPPSNLNGKPSDQSGRTSSGARRLANFGLPVQSIYTVVTALAIVIGSFLLFAWAMRRTNRKSGVRRGNVPSDAVCVLGRVPLAARQFAELLHVGNKLVLVALTPNGPTTLTELSDPAEVDRIVGLCQQFDPHSATKAFEQVFQQFSQEPTGGGFLGSDPLPTSLSSAATTAYRSHRGTGRA